AALGSHRVRDIIIASDGIWLASSAAGLFHYSNGVWTTYLGDREVNALMPVERDGLSPLIYSGTDQGVVVLTSEPGAVWDTLTIGLPADHISQRVVDLAFQPLPCDTINLGAEALWAIVRDSDSDADSMNGFAASTDGGTTWTVSSRRLPSSDVAFFGCRFYLASDSGLAEGSYPSLDAVTFTSSFNTAISEGRISRKVQAVRTVIGKDYSGLDSLAEVWVGTERRLARSLNATLSWGVAFSNPDPNEFDLFRNFGNLGKDTLGDFIALSGNFVTALALQPNPANPVSGKPILWAATRGTGRGRYENETSSYPSRNGISFSRDGGETWTVPELDALGTSFDVWNLSFDDQQVWAASSQGLLGSADGLNWTVRHNFEDPQSGATIDTTVEILDAETVGSELWVGTENGLLVLGETGNRLSGSDAEATHAGRIRRTFRPVDPDDRGSGGGAYATPVPYSPTYARSRGGLRLHYVPPVSGDVTITVYDFANNVVTVLTRGEYRNAGIQYDESVVWDGRNGDGDVVAVGTYFFVIEYENGDVHWGKIAIIP
ncbi:MAG TPA: hypothetical protein VM118_10755, partial [Acidobacteriota bacterium]|nr:hypothetical protein [Acidobacteriota bacterium]